MTNDQYVVVASHDSGETPNVRFWLQADLPPPEIDFRSASNNGHSSFDT
jgi:hypothetical protein